jgi:hypothetical protein
VGKRDGMNEAEIQQGFSRAGWELDGSFYDHLTIAYTEDLSILAYPKAWVTGEQRFQLCDHENGLTCWVREIVSPERAAQLLQEHGQPMTEE